MLLYGAWVWKALKRVYQCRYFETKNEDTAAIPTIWSGIRGTQGHFRSSFLFVFLRIKLISGMNYCYTYCWLYCFRQMASTCIARDLLLNCYEISYCGNP